MKQINILIENDSVANEFIKMVSWMDYCGKVGHCSGFHVNFDGDGRARIEVETSDGDDYEIQRKKWNDDNYRKSYSFDGEMRFSID